MRRIKAFTLTELLVVMILTSIVFIIVFYALRTVTVFQLKQASINTEAREYMTLNKLLESDFLSSNLCQQNEEKILLFSSPKFSSVAYYFSDSFICRSIENRLTDTFHVITRPPIITINYLTAKDAIVKELEIFANFKGQPIVLHYEKEYSTEISINKEIDSLKNELH